MSKLPVLAAALVASGLVVVGAHAGPAAIDDRGNALVVDAALDPPVSSAKGTRGVELRLHAFYGNVRGDETPTEPLDISFRPPPGAGIASSAFGRCKLATTREQAGDASRCPARSRVGTGRVLVDARKAGGPDRLEGDVALFNGVPHDGRPTLILIATMPGGLRLELDFEIRRGPVFVEFYTDATPREAVPFDITELDVELGRTTVVTDGGRRRRVPFLSAPRRCRGEWSYEVTFARDSGELAARDRSPCTNPRR